MSIVRGGKHPCQASRRSSVPTLNFSCAALRCAATICIAHACRSVPGLDSKRKWMTGVSLWRQSFPLGEGDTSKPQTAPSGRLCQCDANQLPNAWWQRDVDTMVDPTDVDAPLEGLASVEVSRVLISLVPASVVDVLRTQHATQSPLVTLAFYPWTEQLCLSPA